jgi:hypothetical protein
MRSLIRKRAFLALVSGFGLTLAACSGGSSGPTAPDLPPGQDPPPVEQGGVQGSYVLERINESQPGQLVTIANPDGEVIGLYRFDASMSVLTLDALQTYDLTLNFTDDKSPYHISDAGEFKGAGQQPDGALTLTFTSKDYGDSFIGAVTGDFVAFQYDFDGDGQPDTKLGFRRTK